MSTRAEPGRTAEQNSAILKRWCNLSTQSSSEIFYLGRSAVGRERPVVTVRDFSASATCYAALNGRVRPRLCKNARSIRRLPKSTF
jgi:hypothetical protein